jgi:hypothetical protein
MDLLQLLGASAKKYKKKAGFPGYDISETARMNNRNVVDPLLR